MRVLHLPSNIASQISVTVRALNEVGVEARGLVYRNPAISDETAITTFDVARPVWRHPFLAAKQELRWLAVFKAAARWADVIHWHYSRRALPCDLDLRYLALKKRARLVEFWGSDIRIPEIAVVGNPYLARLIADPDRDYDESYRRSRETQARFARYGFECLTSGFELGAYVQPDLFPAPYRTEPRLMLSDFEVCCPDPNRSRPLVVHAPSRLKTKGTEAVLRAVEQLRKQYDFDFRLIHGVSHNEALALVRECDVMLDQFVVGSYGFAALEAMAFGKPTVCFLKPSLVPQFPPDFPLVNASEDNLVQVLGSLLGDGLRRHALGRASRAYVEKHHDARVVARQLAGIYEELLRKRQSPQAGNC